MKGKTTLIIAAGAMLMLGIGWLVIHSKRKKRDTEAAQFFSELERTVAPATEGIASSNAFDIKYWQRTDVKPIYMKQSYAQDFAKQIYSAWGTVWNLGNDDEDKIYGVFRALRDQVQVSQIAWQYYQLYKKNLIDVLRSELEPEEIGQIMEIVNKLVPYRENKKK